jgi:PAS domain S-box-containing protein
MKLSVDHPVKDVILDSINEGVFTVDKDWRISSFNRAAEKITGISKDDALGKSCRDIFKANVCESNCALKRTFETGRPMVNATVFIMNRQDKRVPIRLSTAILKDDSGAVIGGVETFQDLSQVEQLRKQLHRSYTFEDIVGRSPAMMQLFEVLPQIAESSSNVLIEGPSGTGKELFARAIHNLSPRRNNPFVAVNCAALPDTLLESELFGHKAGAFTDARHDKAGRFVRAEKGTIFLDEIGDISPAMQVRLLRVLQDRRVEPLGAETAIQTDVRVLAATNRNLAELTRKGRFRDDLYYRIRVVHITLPGLHERREDIPLLVEHLVAKFNHLMGREIAGVSMGVMARLLEHDFPGNVRELENIIEQAFVLCRGGLIDIRHLPQEMRTSHAAPVDTTSSLSLSAMEKVMISEILKRNGGNRKRTAAELGVHPSTLFRKIRALGIAIPDTDGRGKRT